MADIKMAPSPVADADPAKAPMNKGARTRERVLQIAERAVLSKGFGATSLDEITAEAGLTKSGFLYHFKDKNQLALALIDRAVAHDHAMLDTLLARAADLSDDPLQRVLISLKLLAEEMEALPDGHPGCLVAATCYQENLFSLDIRERNRESMLVWRERYRDEFERVLEVYDPVTAVDLDDLADLIASIVEGGIVMTKAMREPDILPRHILQLRTYFGLLFRPKAA